MNVVIMVSDGYPFKYTANNSKGEFIALGMKNAGCTVTMIDSIHGTKGITKIQKGVSLNGIPYVIFPRKGKYSAFIHNIPIIWSILKKAKQKDSKNHLLMGMMDYPFFIIISIIGKLLGYKRSTLFHEWHIAINNSNYLWKIEAFIKDKTFGYFLDAIFPISRYLKEKAEKFHKPMLLVPVIASFSEKVDNNKINNYFTYCGHATYLERNHIIIDAFKEVLKKHPTIRLKLILIGTDLQKSSIEKSLFKKGLIDFIEIKSNIPQCELFSIYKSSIGLLIPLDPNNIQDKARFSQKIAEYVGSKRPIITNNVGEIPYYFKHNESAIIVPFSTKGFEEGMLSLIENQELSDIIGKNGYNIGFEKFNYEIVGKQITNFISQL